MTGLAGDILLLTEISDGIKVFYSQKTSKTNQPTTLHPPPKKTNKQPKTKPQGKPGSKQKVEKLYKFRKLIYYGNILVNFLENKVREARGPKPKEMSVVFGIRLRED